MKESKSVKKMIQGFVTLTEPYTLTTRDKAILEHFQVLYTDEIAEKFPVLLCTESGNVLFEAAALSSHPQNLALWKGVSGYVLAASEESLANPVFHTFLSQFTRIAETAEKLFSRTERVLNSLDSVKKSISVFDKDGRLLFANKYFCDYLYIPDRDAVIGKSINDIIAKSGTKIYSIDTNSSRLKMNDVLKKGEEVIDWEVRITSVKGDSQLVGNDMYPVISPSGEVDGMVEITHSRKQILDHAKKFAGLSAEYTFDNIIGASTSIREAIRAAKDYADTQLSLLITGESGVGKELFAQSVHNYSSRSKGPFVALNCASFPENLIESELFGYVGGAFTGAAKQGQMGKFELADGGTLFLDEVGELPIHFQSKLLRVLETWTITRIGSGKQVPVNVRLIAATNRNLEKMVEEGLFRQDLYYRLQILNVEIPPLRQRRDDILLLAEDLLRQGKSPDDITPKKLSVDAQKMLLGYDWPGNVRELRNVLYRAALLAKTNTITKDVIASSISANGTLAHNVQQYHSEDSDISAEERLARCREDVNTAKIRLIREALEITGGNRSKAAELLGVSRNTLYRYLENYHID